MRSTLIHSAALLATAAQAACADVLYVSSYSGKVTSLNLTSATGAAGSVPAMKDIGSSTGCGDNPSWLTLDHANAVLYCVDEGFNTGGALASLRTNSDGSLTSLNKVGTKAGPVSAVFFGKKGLSMAH